MKNKEIKKRFEEKGWRFTECFTGHCVQAQKGNEIHKGTSYTVVFNMIRGIIK